MDYTLKKNLIYMCVFFQESYINLLELLIKSLVFNGNVNKETTDILIITSSNFQKVIDNKLKKFNLPIQYFILNINTLMDSSCCKLNIFSYEKVDNYENLLYLDTDVLINSDVNILFNTDIRSDKIYALEEGNIGETYWGSEFFDFSKYDRNLSAFSAGVLYFKNSKDIRNLIDSTLSHIDKYINIDKRYPPVCLDQPFLVYNCFIQDKIDNKLMKRFLENNPSNPNPHIIIYHFPGGPGHYSSKIQKMEHFWDRIKCRTFETRNDMIQYYCSKLSSPKIAEIGVFKGEFLDKIVNTCNFESIVGIDLFTGVTCSGDCDGNNVVYCNLDDSYTSLLEKYKNSEKVTVVKSSSVEYLNTVPDNYYDIIYLDGDHSYNGVKNDIDVSLKKIKTGGFIMGHDYEMNMNKARNKYDFGVKRAVDEFCKTHGFFITAKGLDGCVSYAIQIFKP